MTGEGAQSNLSTQLDHFGGRSTFTPNHTFLRQEQCWISILPTLTYSSCYLKETLGFASWTRVTGSWILHLVTSCFFFQIWFIADTTILLSNEEI